MVLLRGHSDRANIVRGDWKLGAIELFAPSLFVAEIGNVFWKRAVLRQDIGDSEVTALYDELVKTPPALIEIRALAPRAFEIAINAPHPVYDCFYIAAAEHLGCDLITADERMAAKFSTDFPFIRRLSTI